MRGSSSSLRRKVEANMLKTQPKWVWLLAMIAWLLTPVATAAAPPAPTHDKLAAPAPTTVRVTVNLQTNHWELYPRREEIFLQSMERLPDGLGVVLSVRSSMKGFAPLPCTP